MNKPLFALLLCFSVTACGDAGPAMSVSDVQVVAPMPGHDTSVAYLTLHNHSNQAVALTAITSPQFSRIELHQTVVANGIASMRPLTSLTIDANASAELAPGGKHVMLFEPSQQMSAGSNVTLQFHFSSDDLVVIETPIKSRLSTE